MDQRLSGTLATARFNTLLLTILGGVGLLLAACGIYGVIAYFVSQRTQEIGVRMALGATPGSVVGLILRQALKPVALGTAIGVATALGSSRVLASQLFEVSATDPITIGVVIGALLGVALLARIVPARRAAADPTRALQAEWDVRFLPRRVESAAYFPGAFISTTMTSIVFNVSLTSLCISPGGSGGSQ